ncbi:MAG: hypothetical protein STHCBS139747_007931 [Sporothrix thermara]
MVFVRDRKLPASVQAQTGRAQPAVDSCFNIIILILTLTNLTYLVFEKSSDVSASGATTGSDEQPSRERQARLTQSKTAKATATAAASVSASTFRAAAQPASRVSSQSRVRASSNASTGASSDSGSNSSGNGNNVRSVQRGPSSSTMQFTRPSTRPSTRAVKSRPSSIQTSGTSRLPASRSLPAIPQSPCQPQPQPHSQQQTQQRPVRQARPPPGLLSSRPPLQQASFAQRMARAQFDPNPKKLPPPITAPADLLSKEQVLPPRWFHMDGQTYDQELSLLKLGQMEKPKVSRPPSSGSECGRIGPWTDKETGHHTDSENKIDVRQYVSLSHQSRPRRACFSLDCNGNCRDCKPMVLSFRAPEQKSREKVLQQPQQSQQPQQPQQPQPQQQQRRAESVSRSPPPQQQRLTQQRNSQTRQPQLWVPRFSSPLRQAHPPSPYEPAPPSPEVKRPSSPHPSSEDVSPMSLSPLEPPPRSPLRDGATSPKPVIMPFSSPSPDPFATTTTITHLSKSCPVAPETDFDTAVAKAIRKAEKENGGPLLPWDVEAIKASMEGRLKAKRRKQPQSQPQSKQRGQPKVKTMPFVAWHKDPEANRAASESSTTALAFLLKTLSGMPADAQQTMGIVGIGSVGQRRFPHPTSPATATTKFGTPAGEPPASAQRAAIYEDDGLDDYTTSWPEGAYYFGNVEQVP